MQPHVGAVWHHLLQGLEDLYSNMAATRILDLTSAQGWTDPLKQAGHTEMWSMLRWLEHSSISTVTNAKLNTTIYTSSLNLPYNVKLGSAFAPHEN
jgi:hypothetical protein